MGKRRQFSWYRCYRRVIKNTWHKDSGYGEFGLKQSKLWDKGTLCITIAANIAETAILAYPMCFPDSVVGFNANSNESSELFMYYVFEYIRNSIQVQATMAIQNLIKIIIVAINPTQCHYHTQ